MNDPKEADFEKVRKAEYQDLPSRLKSLYVFESLDLVERAQNEWFPNDKKRVFEVRVVKGSRLHRADSRWLNCLPTVWKENAQKYWSGIMSDDPFPEIIVHGAIYFPNWKSFSKLLENKK